MSGSVVPGVGSEEELRKLQAEQENVTDAIRDAADAAIERARLSSLEDTKPKPKGPQEEISPTDQIMSGTIVGLTGVGKNPDSPAMKGLEMAGIAVATPLSTTQIQHEQDDRIMRAMPHVNDPQQDIQQTMINQSGLAGGVNVEGTIASEAVQRHLAEIEAIERDKDADRRMLAAMDEWDDHDLFDAIYDLNNDIDKIDKDMNAACAQNEEAKEALRSSIDVLNEKIANEKKEISDLKQRLANADSPEQKAYLEDQIRQKNDQLTQLESLSAASKNVRDELAKQEMAATEKFGQLKERTEALRAQLNGGKDLTDEQREAIKAELVELQGQKQDVEKKINHLRETAQQVVRMQSDVLQNGELSHTSMALLATMRSEAGNETPLDKAIGNYAGQLGKTASSFVLEDETKLDRNGLIDRVDDIDVKRHAIMDLINTPNNGLSEQEITNKKLELKGLEQKRVQYENVLYMCVLDKIEMERSRNAAPLVATSPSADTFDIKDAAGNVLGTGTLGLVDGKLAITSKDGGEPMIVANLSDKDIVLASIQDGLKQGKTVPQDVADAMAALGSPVASASIATSPNAPAPTQEKAASFDIKNDAGAVVASMALAMIGGELTLVNNQTGDKHELRGLSAADQKMILSSIQDGITQGKTVAPEVGLALAALGVTGATAANVSAAPVQPSQDPAVIAQEAKIASIEYALSEEQLAEMRREQDARIEQERLEENAIDRLMAGGSMSSEEFDKLKRILGEDYAKKLAEENNVKVEAPVYLQSAQLLGSMFLFTGMAGYAGREIASGPSQDGGSLLGIWGGNYKSFADSDEFSQYNDPNQVDPSYAQPSAFTMMAGLANMFGFGGPAPQTNSSAYGDQLALQRDLDFKRQQDLLAQMGLLSGPQAPQAGQV